MRSDKLLQKENALLCGLFLIALIIRLVIGLVMFCPPLNADAHVYETFALSILSGQNMYGLSQLIPLYPMFLASTYFIGGHHHFLVVIVQSILSVLMCVIIFFSSFDWEIIGYGIYNFSFAFILPFTFLGLFASFGYKSGKNIRTVHLLLLYNFLNC